MKVNLNHILLLGWHSANGQRNLTTWTGTGVWVDVVIKNATDKDLSNIMGNNPLHKDFQLLLIPPQTNKQEYAKLHNGISAFGWYVESGINRPPNRPMIDEWQWYNDLLKHTTIRLSTTI
jgi:hypothetical protein